MMAADNLNVIAEMVPSGTIHVAPDDGCRLFSSCLYCHLTTCVEDMNPQDAARLQSSLEARLTVAAALYGAGGKRPRSVDEAAALFGVSERTWYRWRTLGMIPSAAMPKNLTDEPVDGAEIMGWTHDFRVVGKPTRHDDGRGQDSLARCRGCGVTANQRSRIGEVTLITDEETLGTCSAALHSSVVTLGEQLSLL